MPASDSPDTRPRRGAAGVSKPVSASKTEMTEIVMPNDANPLGNCMGGRVMHWIDICAAVAGGRHAGTPVVTASVDQIDFRRPVRVGAVLVLLASVNYVHRTSMEVGVKVFTEDRASGDRQHVASAYLTFVSLDWESSRPRPVPGLVAESPEEQRRQRKGEARRNDRLARLESADETR